jgi:hypothetical protein
MKRVIHAVKPWFPYISIPIIAILIAIALYNLKFTFKRDMGDLIAHDVAQLAQVLKKINDDCYILSVHGQKNPINFLNIKKGGFSGSQVGPLNLARPAKWQGPYEGHTLEIQDIPYLLVKTKKGYFISPGLGVKLPNGKIIGKDIILDENADINELISSGLTYNSKPLVASVQIGADAFAPAAERVLVPEE